MDLRDRTDCPLDPHLENSASNNVQLAFGCGLSKKVQNDTLKLEHCVRVCL